MKGGVYMDPESEVVREVWALVRTPRKGRKRFPENCVQEVAGMEEALDGAGPGVHPARVCGPARSSEGLRLYYLVRWLD